MSVSNVCVLNFICHGFSDSYVSYQEILSDVLTVKSKTLIQRKIRSFS